MLALLWIFADLSAATGNFSVVYRNYGLNPVREEAWFKIRLDGDGKVTCGWSDRKEQHRPKVASQALSGLADLVTRSGFFKLPEFNKNFSIIDGGMEELEIHLGARSKKVEMANTGARPFAKVREELLRVTGCDLSRRVLPSGP